MGAGVTPGLARSRSFLYTSGMTAPPTDLSDAEKSVLDALQAGAGPDGSLACHVADLAVETGYTQRHVFRVLASLRDSGRITVEGIKGGGGRPNTYRIQTEAEDR